MSRKPVRFGLLIVGLLISAALAFRAVNNEASLGRAYRESVAHNLAAGQALEALLDLRASLYAYVAPGQGVPFWSRRSEQLLDSLRQHLVTLDAAAAPSGGSLAETLDAVDQLAAAERRSREYARRGETLLAGDVVFTEVRDVLAEATDQIYTARSRLAAAHDRRVSALRREQAIIGAAAVITWIAIALLLVTPDQGGAREGSQRVARRARANHQEAGTQRTRTNQTLGTRWNPWNLCARPSRRCLYDPSRP